MANPEHLQILRQGVEAWNAWRDQYRDIRPNLNGADLGGDMLRGANFSGADLTRANFSQTNLAQTNLIDANLAGANLTEAYLAGANLFGANFTGADLREADLPNGRLYETVFSNTNLTKVRGLEICEHSGPSTLDHRTLAQSGPLPLDFLRGCGFSDWEIEATKLYDPHLTSGQVTDIIYRIHHLRTDPLIQFYSCFISYASRDLIFAKSLHADLQNKSVRCWFAPVDMQIGDEFRSCIDSSIHFHDRLLLILSEHSLKSRWVQKEVETAFEKEERENRLVLCPIRLDEAVMQIDVGRAADIRRQRHIGDLTRWKDYDAYQHAFARLLRDLTSVQKTPEA
jgi:uncharacterized protein YjbI with pentapeptide repeats